MSLLGSVIDLHVSENSQHLFTAITRKRWELNSVQRNKQICEELKKNPNNIYLQSYAQTCNIVNTVQIDFNLFGQYTSSCFPFTYVEKLNSKIYFNLK